MLKQLHMLSRASSFALQGSGYKRATAVNQRFFSNEGSLKKTSLYDLHVKDLKAKMVEFAGWSMPIHYPTETIIQSHLHTRENSSLFDVSHMCQLKLTGAQRVEFLESLVVADLKALKPNHAVLSLMTNEKGGIIDDTVITNKGDHIYFVVNAGCADKDKAHLRAQLASFKAKNKTAQVELTEIPGALIALQGPKSESVLKKLLTKPFELEKMPFMTSANLEVDGIPVLVGRCGYTGEDGFEISVPDDKAIRLAKKLLSNPVVKPAGLGARDSLRLEAGLCLYGHDIEQDVSPIEASLLWTIGKRRREEGGFLGANVILKQIKDGVSRKRVGLIVDGPPAREGYTIHDKQEKEIGKITSGTLSPVLKKAISMAYVNVPFHQIGTEVQVKVRNKLYPGVISKMPFVPTNYKKL